MSPCKASSARLARLRKLQAQSPGADNTGEDPPQESAAGGDTPELHVVAEENERGELQLRTAGAARPAEPVPPDTPAGVTRASRLMADEEVNILHHRHPGAEPRDDHHHDDYEHYSNMHHDHGPGGFER
ncbi:hypothetical protein [Erwinia sp. V71]|uniref:hypothetical protein n=1 Tax=Erwinia sp. V71 TaxID=3369424 RepID=UPI003F5EF999